MRNLNFCKKINRQTRGFTLAELMMAAAILGLTLAGILLSYKTCVDLAEMSQNTSIATHAVKSRLETVKNTSFDQIKITYDNTTFTVGNLNGIGVSYVDDSNPRLLLITVSFSWRQKNGRVIGEDKDLDGVLDLGEDLNGNSMLDSIVQASSYIFER